MKPGVPWQVEGIRRLTRESAQEAARRAGLSVGEWLDAIILASALHAGVGPMRSARPQNDPLDEPGAVFHDAGGRPAELPERLSLQDDKNRSPAADHGFAELKDHLDSLSRQLNRLTQNAADAKTAGTNRRGEEPPRRLVEATSELDRRLDHPVPAETEPAQHKDTVVHASPTSDPLPRARTQGLSCLEQQLRQINTQVETLRQPCRLDKAVNTLRDDLAEIGLMLQEAMPRKAVEALEGEVRNLADRIDNTRHAGADAAALSGVERGLAEVRDALRGLTPAESLVDVGRTLQELSHKVDLLASNAQDPSKLHQLESAIIAMRGIASHVASNAALANLSEEVRALTRKVDEVASSGSAGLLSALEDRIAMLADALAARNQRGNNLPYELAAVVKGLMDKIERMQLTHGDPAALAHLEDRISKLVEKLDASDARLSRLEAIERGLATDKRAKLAQPPDPSPPGAASLLAPAAPDAPKPPPATAPASAISAINAPAMQGKPNSAAPPSLACAPMLRAAAAELRSDRLPVAERRPIDPDLPPDHPLEPGSVPARGRIANSPAERIAASEATLVGATPAVIPDAGGKLNFIAAARRAAQAAGRDNPATTTTPGEIAWAAGKLAKRVEKLRALIVGATAVILVLGSLQFARTLLSSGHESELGSPSESSQTVAAAAVPPATTADPIPTREPPPLAQPVVPAPAAERHSGLPAVDATATATPPPEIVVPAEVARPAIAAPASGSAAPAAHREVAGSTADPAQPAGSSTAIRTAPSAAASAPSTRAPPPLPGSDRLPSAFGSGLRTAAVKGDAGAQYEVALRYFEGRGAPQNFAEAADWFERSASQGLAPAQFRLAGMYEKGLGVKKDLEAARRLYLAAGEAGHGKALHNLAVLYAEGIDGKPDYQTAAKWFRKAADYGIADSQYNLAILYARGIGVEQHLAESYKWFALAAREGDTESAKKRDDVGAHLDQQSRNAAARAAQGWRPQPQPEATVQVKVPAGGWDAIPPSAPAPAKRKPPAVVPQRDLATPRSAQ